MGVIEEKYKRWCTLNNLLRALMVRRLTFNSNHISRECYCNIHVQHTPLPWHHNERDGVWNHQPHDVYSGVYSGTDQRNIKASRHWPLWGEFTCDRGSPRTRASNAENVSIWWRHHAIKYHMAFFLFCCSYITILKWAHMAVSPLFLRVVSQVLGVNVICLPVSFLLVRGQWRRS